MSTAFFIALASIATSLLMAPVARYLHIGWYAKRADVMEGQSTEARLQYFAMFRRNQAVDITTAYEEFEQFYDRWYGRSRYLMPTALLLCTGLVVAYIGIGSALLLNGSVDPGLVPIQMPPLGLAALSGGYLWVVNDFITRSRRLDFSPSDIYWGVLRLVVAIPLGYGISWAIPGTPEVRSFVAFSTGAFPLSVLLANIRRMSLVHAGQSAPSPVVNDNVIKLVGVNGEIAERFANEDISTITQLAYCDPIRLTMRSGLSFNFITECMNQALAWLYMEERMSELRRLGLRGAVEIRHLYKTITSQDPATRQIGEAILASVSGVITQDVVTLRMVIFEIAEDPFTLYLNSVWTGGDPKCPRAPHPSLAGTVKVAAPDGT